MSELDNYQYDNLIAGQFPLVTEVITIGQSQSIIRGDVLVRDPDTKTFGRATAAVSSTDVVLIASEDVTTDESTTENSIGYRTGEFNSNAMRFGGTSTDEDNRDILSDKSIYLKKAQRS